MNTNFIVFQTKNMNTNLDVSSQSFQTEKMGEGIHSDCTGAIEGRKLALLVYCCTVLRQ